MSVLQQILAKLDAQPRRQRACKVPDYECLIFPDTNANPGLIIDIISQLDYASQLAGGKAIFKVGLTDVLLKENCNYLVLRGNSDLVETGIAQTRAWQKEVTKKCILLDNHEKLRTQKGAEVTAPFLQLLEQAEQLITGDLAFLVGKLPERFTGKPEYKGAKIPIAREAVLALETAIDKHESAAAIQEKAMGVQTAMKALGQAMYAVLPKTFMDYQDDPDLFRMVSNTTTEYKLREAFAKVLLPQVRLRLMAYHVNKDHMRSPDDMVITPELRQAYTHACQPIHHYKLADMRGVETVGIIASEKDTKESFSQALLDRGFEERQPVTVTVRESRRVIQAEEIKDELAHIGPLEEFRFELNKIGDESKPQPCSLDEVKRYISGEEPTPYGYELIVFTPARTLSYLRVGSIDESLVERDLTNSVLSIDIVKHQERDPGKEPEPLELPQNPTLDRHIKQRLFELAKEGKTMMSDLKKTLFHLRKENGVTALLGSENSLAETVCTPNDFSDEAIINKMCYIPSYKENVALHCDHQIDLLQQIFFHTDALRQYMSKLPKNGPYGSVKNNAGERSVYELPVIDKQARVMTADNYDAARMKEMRGEGEMPDRLARAQRTMSTRDLHIFVSEDTGAKREGAEYLQSSEGHVPLLALSMKEFYMLSKAMAAILRRQKRVLPATTDQNQVFERLDTALAAYGQKLNGAAPPPSQIDELIGYYIAPATQHSQLLTDMRKRSPHLASLIERANACDMERLIATFANSQAPSVGGR